MSNGDVGGQSGPRAKRSPWSLILAALGGCAALGAVGLVAAGLLLRKELDSTVAHVEARVHARDTPGVPVVDPALPAGVVELRLVPNFADLPPMLPVDITLGPASGTLIWDDALRLGGVGAGTHSLRADGCLLDPATVDLPGGSHGVQLAARAIPVDPAPLATTLPAASPPEHVLEVDLTRPGELILRWRQGATVIAIEEAARTAELLAPPALSARFEAHWKTYRSHFDPADEKLDQAIVRITPAVTFADVAPVVRGLLAPKRVVGADTVAAFRVSVQPPARPTPRRVAPRPQAMPPWKGPPPELRIRVTTVSGRLPPALIDDALAASKGDLQRCYEDGLRRDRKLIGMAGFRFVIGADGGVSNVTNPGSDMPDEDVESCVLGVIDGFSFPRPGGGIVVVQGQALMAPPR